MASIILPGLSKAVIFVLAAGLPSIVLADQVAKQVLLEAKLVEVSDRFVKDSNLPERLAKALGKLPGVDSQLSSPDAANSGLGAAPTADTIKTQFFDDDDEEGPPRIRLASLLTPRQSQIMIETILRDKDSKIISGPVVPTWNGQPAQVNTGPTSGQLSLKVIPQLSPDGTGIDLQIVPQVGNVGETFNLKTGTRGFPALGDIPVLGGLFRQQPGGGANPLLIFLTPRLVDALTGGPEDANDPVKTEVEGTGETIGHVADLKISNVTGTPLLLYIPPMLLESKSEKNQDYVCPQGQEVKLAAKQTKKVPLEGVCISRDKPPVGQSAKGDLAINTGDPGVTNDPDCDIPAAQVSQLLHVSESVHRAVREVLKDGALKNFPYKEKKEQEKILTQWAMWQSPEVSQVSEVPPATKEDLRQVVYKQAEKKGPIPPAGQAKLDEGIDQIFAQIELTSEKAKELDNPGQAAETNPPGSPAKPAATPAP